MQNGYVTLLEQCTYIKKAILLWRNVRECHNELVEAMGNNAHLVTVLQHFSLTVWLFLCTLTVLVELHPFYAMLDVQLNFYYPLCYYSRAHCSLLQCLCTTSAILADTHFYFVVSLFKYEGKK